MAGRIKDGLNAVIKLLENPLNVNNTSNAYNINNFMKSIGSAIKKVSNGESISSSIASITIVKWAIKSWDNISDAINGITDEDGNQVYDKDEVFSSIIFNPENASISSSIEEVNTIIINEPDIEDEDNTLTGTIQIDENYTQDSISKPIIYNGNIVCALQMATLMYQVENGYTDNISAENLLIIQNKILEAKAFMNKFGIQSYLIPESQLVERG